VTHGRDELLLVRGSRSDESIQEVKPDEQELIPTKEPNSYREKEKAGSIRGGTGSGGQSSQQMNAMKN
jgi:hypothetical protein